MLGWLLNLSSTAKGPYRVVAGAAWLAGAAATEDFSSGASAGETFHTGEETGEVDGRCG